MRACLAREGGGSIWTLLAAGSIHQSIENPNGSHFYHTLASFPIATADYVVMAQRVRLTQIRLTRYSSTTTPYEVRIGATAFSCDTGEASYSWYPTDEVDIILRTDGNDVWYAGALDNLNYETNRIRAHTHNVRSGSFAGSYEIYGLKKPWK